MQLGWNALRSYEAGSLPGGFLASGWGQDAGGLLSRGRLPSRGQQHPENHHVV